MNFLAYNLFILLSHLLTYSFSCQTDSDCSMNSILTTCVSNNCEPKSCTSDQDCTNNNVASKCVENYCTLLRCTEDYECTNENFFFECNSTKYCIQPTTCPEEYSLSTNGLCTKRTCSQDSDCHVNNYFFTCSSGTCSKTACSTHSDCHSIKPSSLCGIFNNTYGMEEEGCTQTECTDFSACSKYPNYGCDYQLSKCSYMSCSSDNDCKPFSIDFPFCSGGFCRRAQCTNDTFCFQNYPSSPICINGQCGKVDCNTVSDCGGYQYMRECRNNSCYPSSCLYDYDCNEGTDKYVRSCQFRKCLPTAYDDATSCSPVFPIREGNFCKKVSCTSTNDCDGYGSTRCQMGLCVDIMNCLKKGECGYHPLESSVSFSCSYDKKLCEFEFCKSNSHKCSKEWTTCQAYETYSIACQKKPCTTATDCFTDGPLCTSGFCSPATCSNNSDCKGYPLTPSCVDRVCRKGFCKTHGDCADFNQTRLCSHGRCVEQNCSKMSDCVGLVGLPLCGPAGKCIAPSCASIEDCRNYPRHRKCGWAGTCEETLCSKDEDCSEFGDSLMCGQGGYCIIKI